MPIRTLLAVLILAASSRADDLAIFPDRITLHGPDASQYVIVESRSNEHLVGDATATATLRVENPSLATVTSGGVVSPIADGETRLIARIGDREASVPLVVKGFGTRTIRSFRNDVLPVLTRSGCNSGACHGAAAGKNGFRLTLRGYGPEIDFDVITRQTLGRRIDKSAPERSLFLLKPTGAVEHGGGIKFAVDSPEYRILSGWIADGLPRPKDDDPRVVRLRTDPPAVRLRPGQTQSVIVRAEYSDGRIADVTRWAKFGSTDETVAKVDESGRVKVEGPGEAAITVWFASAVDLATVSVPSAALIDPKVFAAAPRRNPLDEINLRKLAELNIPPSPECSDSTFLRRAYLDLTGTLPPADRARTFSADPDREKRSKLVEELLKSPEYVDYWTYKWSDLFLVSSKTLPPSAMWAFYRSIREAVSDNIPWDGFARRILTAKGSTLATGEANYFVLHRDPVELTDNVSMAFLGFSLTCARCHNHPMEKWTQDQYYGMANIFARVSLKDGRDQGEVIVTPSPTGDVIHPRKGVAMAPQPLDGIAAKLDGRDDRRPAFVDWLADPSNPYFDRAIVNRVFRNFFGRGLVEPEDDLRATNPASDEALMAWLVSDFRTHNRDLKHLIRTIMNSAAYSRSSEAAPGNEGDAKFLSHYVVKRLQAEVLLDAIARVTDVPNTFAGYPPGYRALQLPDSQVANAFLISFGRAERLATCSCERSAEPSLTQALHLANGDTINPKLRDDRSAAAKLAASKASESEVVERLFAAALSREPTPAERERLTKILASATSGLSDPIEIASARRQAVEDLFWSVLTAKEFLFNH